MSHVLLWLLNETIIIICFNLSNFSLHQTQKAVWQKHLMEEDAYLTSISWPYHHLVKLRKQSWRNTAHGLVFWLVWSSAQLTSLYSPGSPFFFYFYFLKFACEFNNSLKTYKVREGQKVILDSNLTALRDLTMKTPKIPTF